MFEFILSICFMFLWLFYRLDFFDLFYTCRSIMCLMSAWFYYIWSCLSELSKIIPNKLHWCCNKELSLKSKQLLCKSVWVQSITLILCFKHSVISPLSAAVGFLFSITLLPSVHAETKPVPICLMAGLKTGPFCLINVINNVANSALQLH